MASVRDPILDPEVQNEISEMAVKHHEDSVRLLFQNLWPNGYMAGDEQITDKIDKLMALMARHDENLSVVLDETALPGDQERAQQELFEEETLKNEMFANRALREEAVARAESATQS